MKETYNWKSLFAGVGIILIGVVMCIASVWTAQPWDNILLSIGCSLIASGLVILMHDFFVERKKVSILDEWKIERIFSTRAEKNAESDPGLVKAKYRVDVIAFGLGSFRSKQTPKVETCLRKGVNFRIITMMPDSPYAAERDKEENKNNGTTSYSIQQLVEWADKLNSRSMRGKVIVKGYSCMTLDFYWRVDDVIYIGPYWYGVESQQTITYKYLAGGKGFTQYSEYFETLWNNTDLCRPLTQLTEATSRRRKR